MPRPRVELGPRLIGIASAALDVSDGLIADLRHICEVSGLAATVEAARVPLSEAARTVLIADPVHLSTILTGGDDYEILFTVPQTSADAIVELARSSRVPITRIGKMEAPPRETEYSVHVVDAVGRPIALVSQGWTHF